MTSENSDQLDVDDRLGAVLAACLEAADRGAADSQTLLEQHPEYAAELREFFAAAECADRLAAPLRQVALAAQARAATNTETTDLIVFELPQRIDDYELPEELGRGGMGIVFKARQLSLGRLIALKVFRTDPLAAGTERQRFRNEAEMAAHLDHPGIVPIYEVGEWRAEGVHPPLLYFSMKLLDGRSLASNREPAANAGQQRWAAQLVASVARAVHYAHQRGILHCDLKPANIMLDDAGQPHVTDFGLAKRIECDHGLTQTGTIVGTPGYMAPEQASGQRHAMTTVTDVYGLGAVMYGLLTGCPPFQGDSVLDTLQQVRQREPESPSGLNRLLDRDVETICLKCLEKEPGRRYISAEAVAEELERWLRGEPILARSLGRVGRLRRWSRRNPIVAALSTTVVVLVIGAIVGLSIAMAVIRREQEETKIALAEAQANFSRAETQRQRAETNFREACHSIEELLAGFDPARDSGSVTVGELRQYQTNEALRFLTTFCEQSSNDPAVRLQQGVAYVHTGNIYQFLSEREKAQRAFRQAIAVFGHLIEEFPEDPKYPRELGWAYYILAENLHAGGRLQDANACYGQSIGVWREAIRKHPADAESLSQLASFLCSWPDPSLCDPRGAMELARKAVALAPQLPKAWLALGIACYRSGEWNAAVAALQQAQRLKIGDWSRTQIACYLAMAQWRCGQQVVARESYQQAVLLMERNFDARDPGLRAEVAALLGIQSPPTPKAKEEEPGKR